MQEPQTTYQSNNPPPNQSFFAMLGMMLLVRTMLMQRQQSNMFNPYIFMMLFAKALQLAMQRLQMQQAAQQIPNPVQQPITQPSQTNASLLQRIQSLEQQLRNLEQANNPNLPLGDNQQVPPVNPMQQQVQNNPQQPLVNNQQQQVQNNPQQPLVNNQQQQVQNDPNLPLVNNQQQQVQNNPQQPLVNDQQQQLQFEIDDFEDGEELKNINLPPQKLADTYKFDDATIDKQLQGQIDNNKWSYVDIEGQGKPPVNESEWELAKPGVKSYNQPEPPNMDIASEDFANIDIADVKSGLGINLEEKLVQVDINELVEEIPQRAQQLIQFDEVENIVADALESDSSYDTQTQVSENEINNQEFVYNWDPKELDQLIADDVKLSNDALKKANLVLPNEQDRVELPSINEDEHSSYAHNDVDIFGNDDNQSQSQHNDVHSLLEQQADINPNDAVNYFNDEIGGQSLDNMSESSFQVKPAYEPNAPKPLVEIEPQQNIQGFNQRAANNVVESFANIDVDKQLGILANLSAPINNEIDVPKAAISDQPIIEPLSQNEIDKKVEDHINKHGDPFSDDLPNPFSKPEVAQNNPVDVNYEDDADNKLINAPDVEVKKPPPNPIELKKQREAADRVFDDALQNIYGGGNSNESALQNPLLHEQGSEFNPYDSGWNDEDQELDNIGQFQLKLNDEDAAFLKNNPNTDLVNPDKDEYGQAKMAAAQWSDDMEVVNPNLKPLPDGFLDDLDQEKESKVVGLDNEIESKPLPEVVNLPQDGIFEALKKTAREHYKPVDDFDEYEDEIIEWENEDTNQSGVNVLKDDPDNVYIEPDLTEVENFEATRAKARAHLYNDGQKHNLLDRFLKGRQPLTLPQSVQLANSENKPEISKPLSRDERRQKMLAMLNKGLKGQKAKVMQGQAQNLPGAKPKENSLLAGLNDAKKNLKHVNKPSIPASKELDTTTDKTGLGLANLPENMRNISIDIEESNDDSWDDEHDFSYNDRSL